MTLSDTTDIHEIIKELNESNSTNHKLAVLKKHKDDAFLKHVLKMTHDSVYYTYGLTNRQIDKFVPARCELPFGLDFALSSLGYNIATRRVTGHDALQLAANLRGGLNKDDARVFSQVINHDLRTGVGKTQINKIWPGLITKPAYMRCGIYGSKTSKNITFPAILQLKADGTYREFFIQNGVVTASSRSGEKYSYPIIESALKNYPNGVLIGELTVRGCSDRAKGNGLINSSNPPHDDIILDAWDFVSLDEYQIASEKDRKNPCVASYEDRLAEATMLVQSFPSDNINLIKTVNVLNIKEALKLTSGWMKDGYEGSVLKCRSGKFKDGTSKHQLKLKVEMDLEVRVTGTKDGTPGTKREGKIGSILFETDDGKIQGATSGFSDKQMDEFTSVRDSLKGRIMTVSCNDITKASSNEYHALSHPRFVEMRSDRNTTDTLERALDIKAMAMELS